METLMLTDYRKAGISATSLLQDKQGEDDEARTG